jgi:nucleotide-binding universal stress UspA family protein
MDFKDILVHIDSTPQCATRLDLAINLATKQKARLTGLYVYTHHHYQPQGESNNLKAMEAERMFRVKTAAMGESAAWLAVDWGVVGVNMVEVLNYHAHAKDLIVVGQIDSKAQEGGVPADLPERVVLGSGRPVLIVPYAGTFGTIGERVIVGWKAGRASARAINDAMPFLLNAKEVSVLSITAVGDQPMAVKRPDGDICSHLKLYDINVKEENLVTGDIPIADIMMNYGWENGCDLIVLGAYAHTSRGTLNLGPVASDLLGKMTLPVLMSH